MNNSTNQNPRTSFITLFFDKLGPKFIVILLSLCLMLLSLVLLVAILKGYNVNIIKMEITKPIIMPIPELENLEEYGIKITNLSSYNPNNKSFTISGTYKDIPANVETVTFVKADGEELYWPHGEVIFNSSNNTWESTIFMDDETDLKNTIILVCLVGKSGKVFIEYYRKVGRETEQYVPLTILTDNIKTVIDFKVRM